MFSSTISNTKLIQNLIQIERFAFFCASFGAGRRRLAAISRRDRCKSTAAMTTPTIAIGTRAAPAITLTPNARPATPIKESTRTPTPRDRKYDMVGNGVVGRGDLGCRRHIKKKHIGTEHT